MRVVVGALLILSMTGAGAWAQEKGAVTIGTQKGVKMAQDQCQTLWGKANPANKPKISAGQAQPFIADVKAANTSGDGAIDQAEFMAACDKGLMKDPAAASTGTSAGTEGAGGAPAAGTAPPSGQ